MAVREAFKADQMNYELLGNGDAHLHWHLFARHAGDLVPPGPVWWLDRSIMFAEDNDPNSIELTQLKDDLNQSLTDLGF